MVEATSLGQVLPDLATRSLPLQVSWENRREENVYGQIHLHSMPIPGPAALRDRYRFFQIYSERDGQTEKQLT